MSENPKTESEKTLVWASGVIKAAVYLCNYLEQLEQGGSITNNHRLVKSLRKAIWEEDKQNG